MQNKNNKSANIIPLRINNKKLKTIRDRTFRCGDFVKLDEHSGKMMIDLDIHLDETWKPEIICPSCKSFIEPEDLSQNLSMDLWNYGHGFQIKITTSCGKCKGLLDYYFKLNDAIEIEKVV
jgi:hypothetical protein